MTRIYLVRHGQTEWNAAGRWQGTLDIPLSDVGHEQARALAEYLKARDISAIYSSDLSRAVATVEPLALAKGIEIQKDARLRELHFGIFQGLTHAEIREKYPAEERELMTNYMDFIVPEGESRRAMQERAYAMWTDVLERHPAADVVLLSHGGPIRLLLLRLFNDQKERMLRVPLPNAAVTTIAIENGSYHLEGLSETGHLAHITYRDAP